MASPEPSSPKRPVPEPLHLEPENAHLSWTAAMAFHKLATKLYKLTSITEHNDPMSPVKKSFPMNVLIPDNAVIDETTYEDFQHVEEYAGTVGMYSSGKNFQVFSAASAAEIDSLWSSLLAIDHEMRLRHDDKITAKDLSPALADFMAHCCKQRHYFFDILKCGKPECMLCKPLRLSASEFSKLSHLPDSTPGTDGHYKPFQEVFKKPTTEEHRPSAKKASSKATLPFRASVQHVHNAGMMLQCDECALWRLVYAKRKLNSAEKKDLESAIDSMSYSWGRRERSTAGCDPQPKIRKMLKLTQIPAITIIRADIWEKVSVYCKHSGSNYTSSGGSKWKGSMSEVVILQLGPLVCDAVVMESISIPANCEFQLVATLMVDGKMCRNSNVGVLEPQPNFMERHGTFGGNQQRWCNPRANVESRMMIHGAEYVVYYASRTLTKAKHSSCMMPQRRGHLGVAKVLEKAQQRFYWLMFGHNYPLTSCLGSKPLGVITTSTSEYARALEQRLVAAYENVREHLGIEQRRHKQLYDLVKNTAWMRPQRTKRSFKIGAQMRPLSESQYEDVLVEREDDTLMQLMKDMPHSINDAVELARKLETAEQAQRRAPCARKTGSGHGSLLHEPSPTSASANNLSILQKLKCALCSNVLSQPLELTCSALVCTKCLTECIAASGAVNCPFCSDNDLSHVRPASNAILLLLSDVRRHCAGCNRDIRSGDYEGHECVLSLTPEEEKQAAELLKRAIYQFRQRCCKACYRRSSV
eukprot:Em0005g594a